MSAAIPTVFDKPQFLLRLQAGAEKMMYGNVSNCLEVTYRDHDTVAYVEVDASLFHIMQSLGVAVDSDVTLFLEHYQRRMLFGLVVNGQEVIDLWTYTMDKVPKFLLTSGD